ncbi:hypothetical protein CXB51_009817 [Gossypium anomalum]|uniref:RNase H type-1 domain-containing protein n=1 Tax=Gossypium anomalum TaxID=47600 RepID=A0A8J6D1F2_9ROSI|nr:hypothetical protein CXB51_009817 [Gossypium anomalum]
MGCCSLLETELWLILHSLNLLWIQAFRRVEIDSDSAAAVRSILDESAAEQSISHNSSSLESAKEGQDTSHYPGSQCVWPKQAAESTTCCTEEHSLQGLLRIG